ncbi:MAG: homocysteine S-methyltransferase family protein, partial [Candidatus Thiodiazotropha sp. (ex Notomyrtea botanica)]|nr:homocysteine S-methyltransferase family protein [Candidatus Thiodiazotropha sp. (ex Notomyrtea botanica)]
IDIAREADVPFLMCTPTWRANHSRVIDSGVNLSINQDAVRFMKNIRNTPDSSESMIKIGGMIGCKNDCYQPDDGLSETESEDFHSWQINQLAEGDVDFLIAETLPNVEEAIGIAKALERTGLPYIISFVIDRQGAVLDGTFINDAVKRIDAVTGNNPVAYMVNCAYPTFLNADRQPEELFSRLLGYLANASSLDHCDLDGSDDLESEEVTEWGDAMHVLNRTYGINILGGCCGTGPAHLRYLVNH